MTEHETYKDRFPQRIDAGISGKEVRSLMRRNRKTIAGLSFAMGITQKRIREVREHGLSDQNAIRDWVEAITGADPGVLPHPERVGSSHDIEQCLWCGYPFDVGDKAYVYAGDIFCSIRCCRENFGRERERTSA